MTLIRAALAVALALSLITVPLVAAAQQAGRIYRVGFLSVGSRGPTEQLLQVFEQTLRERGWVTGQNLVIEYRFAEGSYDRLPALAAELVRLKPEVIVAVASSTVRAAKDATSTIPIVMWGPSNPIGDGLIKSFARPGGNVTGLTMTSTLDTYAKQLELLKEAVPRARRIGLLWNPANLTAPQTVKTVEKAAATLGVPLQLVGARTPEEFEPAFGAVSQARADALFIMQDAMFFSHHPRLADLSIRHRLPTMHGAVEYAQVGGLMAYAVNRADAHRRVAGYVDRLLRGANPAELPVEEPTRFELVINLKTAKALGLTIPPALLLRADQVIE
jgi:putative tryptophan/tyrosine transport system substrate-binding protein